jgi:hypothetical protein
MPIESAIIKALIGLGSHRGPATAGTESILASLAPYGETNRRFWSDWNEVCSGLTISEIISLAKGLTLAERHLENWYGGSVAGTRWVFNNLVERGCPDIDDVTAWIVDHTSNPYVPFGTTNHFGARTLSDFRFHYAIWQREAELTRERKAQEARDAMMARQLRSLARSRAVAYRGTDVRSQLLTDLNGMTVEAQLKRLIEDEVNPVQFYPTYLAYAANVEILSALDQEVIIGLLERLKGRRRGPWGAFKRRLRGALIKQPGPRDTRWNRR